MPNCRFWLASLLAAVLSLSSLSLRAETTLTEALVTQWMQSLQAVASFSASLDSLGEQMNGGESKVPDLAAALNSLKGSEPYNEFLDSIRQHGFESAEAWLAVHQKILNAMMALSFDEMQAEIRSMTPDLRQAMTDVIPSAAQSVSAEDKALIRSERARIEAFFESQSR